MAFITFPLTFVNLIYSVCCSILLRYENYKFNQANFPCVFPAAGKPVPRYCSPASRAAQEPKVSSAAKTPRSRSPNQLKNSSISRQFRLRAESQAAAFQDARGGPLVKSGTWRRPPPRKESGTGNIAIWCFRPKCPSQRNQTISRLRAGVLPKASPPLAVPPTEGRAEGLGQSIKYSVFWFSKLPISHTRSV